LLLLPAPSNEVKSNYYHNSNISHVVKTNFLPATAHIIVRHASLLIMTCMRVHLHTSMQYR